MAELDDAGVENTDPFSPENVPSVNLVVNMRIYDVLMAIYTHLDEDGAEALHNLHEDGKILGALPYLNLEPTD